VEHFSRMILLHTFCYFCREFEGIRPITPTEGGRRGWTVLNCWELQIPKIAVFKVSTGGTSEDCVGSGQRYASFMSAKYIFYKRLLLDIQRMLQYRVLYESEF
jgi:hypothetical protein